MTVGGVEAHAEPTPAAKGECVMSQPESYIETRIALIRKRLRAHGVDLNKCSASVATECWLVRNTKLFSRLLHPASVQVVELEPGKLGVVSFDWEHSNELEEDAFYDAAYVFTRLTRHRCVQTVSLTSTLLLQQPSYVLSMGLTSNIRHLRLGEEGVRDVNEEDLCEGLGFLRGLESLEVVGLNIGHKLASAVSKLLKPAAVA